MHSITKSTYLSGLQCPKLLWNLYNRPELFEGPPDEESLALMEQGREVGEWAKKLYPDGIDIPFGSLERMLAQTGELLARRVPLFEATFQAGNAECRVDVLVPVGEEAWDLVEVKSGTRVREEHVEEVAFQRYCVEESGLQIRRCHVMHINKEYVRDGAVNPDELLSSEDVSAAVDLIVGEVPKRLEEMLGIIRGAEPETPIGPQCTKPYTCGLIPQCWSFLPDDNVTQLYYNNGFQLLAEGVERLLDVPDDRLDARQRIQQAALRSGEPHVDREAIRRWLGRLQYPVYMLDFETLNPAVPLWDGTRPYQQVPFQVSLHIVPAPGAEAEHVEYLGGDGDPRPGVVEALQRIGPEGDVMAYFASFEKKVLLELAAHTGDDSLAGIADRLVDLIEPFKGFNYYHPRQRGSCSLKAVLPALTGKTYEGSVADGGQAQRAYVQIRNGAENTGELRTALLEYCKQDTQAMIDIVDALEVVSRA